MKIVESEMVRRFFCLTELKLINISNQLTIFVAKFSTKTINEK